jgi:hypothetical protein
MKVLNYNVAFLLVVASVGCHSTQQMHLGSIVREKKPASISASLKHQGYVYFGLSDRQEHKMHVVGDHYDYVQKTKTETIDMNDNVVVYKMTTEDPNSQLYNRVILNKDGIYHVDSYGKNVLDMPAHLKRGTKWVTSERVALTGRTAEMDIKHVVAEFENIVVDDKLYDCVVIDENGTTKSPIFSSIIATRTWYAKDVGRVKIKFSQTSKGKTVKYLSIISR